MKGYDAWKTSSPDDEYVPENERPEGCQCERPRLGDFEWCPVHGRDPDEEYEKWRERQWDSC